MSVGLIALLDDVAALARMAAASLDDIAGQASKAGSKAAGVLIDDAAVTPRYVTGVAAARELPIIGRIAVGSLKNKLLILLPAALALSLFLPQAITPLLMLGGLYLSYEGVEKLFEVFFPHAAHRHEAKVESVSLDPKSREEERIAGAIKTDFILSAEIMVITLGTIAGGTFLTKAVVLAVVGIAVTVTVYGVVAVIVKTDDFGVMLAATDTDTPGGALLRPLGRGLVRGMPYFLSLLGFVGTAAMIWVGGGIILHGAEEYGFRWLAHVIHDAAEAAAHAVPAAGGFLAWLVEAIGGAGVGIFVGLVAIPLMSRLVSPLWRSIKSGLRRA